MFGLKNRGSLPSTVQDEFENLFARLRGFLDVSFNEDGTLIAPADILPIPIGGIIQWPTNTAPDGYLLCDGNQISRDDFRNLFNVIGVIYGAGDGSTTFNLPDLRGRFVLGKAAAGTGSTLAGTGGALDHTHAISGSTAAEAAHTHAISSDLSTHSHSISSSGTHTHNINIPGVIVQSGTGQNVFNNQTTATDADGDHNHTGSTGTANLAHSHGSATGAGSSHSHGTGTLVGASANPAFIALNYVIRAQ